MKSLSQATPPQLPNPAVAKNLPPLKSKTCITKQSKSKESQLAIKMH